MVPPGIQICHCCKWCHLVSEFATDVSGATWYSNLPLLQVAPPGGQTFNCNCKMQLPHAKYRIFALRSCSLSKFIWKIKNWKYNGLILLIKKHRYCRRVHFLGPVFFSSHCHSSSSSSSRSILLLSLTESIVIALACANIPRSAPQIQYRFCIRECQY